MTIQTPTDVVRHLLRDRTRIPVVAQAQAYAPANIALCKYWGKRDERLNLPVTSSLSLALGSLGSSVVLAPNPAHDVVTLNGQELPPDSAFVTRATAFLDLFRPGPGFGFRLEACNTIPTAAGFASSASGFAAVVRALDALFGWQLRDRELSILARLGSGSACRSIFPGLVEWQAGVAPDGMDSFAVPVGVEWPELRIALVLVSVREKELSSRVAMKRTVDTSPLYASWPATVARDLADIKAGLKARDFARVGAAAERNALTMHATMLAAVPPVLYWQPDSVRILQRLWSLRSGGLAVYGTMDAGPNVKVLYEARDEARVLESFADVQLVRPSGI